MTGGRRPWLGLLLLLTSTVTLAATTPQAALEAIDACVQRLNPDADTGYDRIAARCPNLAHRLSESGLSVWLPREWQRPRNDLTVGGLRELRGLLERELTPNPQRVSILSVDRVPAVLASLDRRDCVCRLRHWRWQVDRVVATCPHAPRASLRSQGRSSGL